jgi:hypothetical protein
MYKIQWTSLTQREIKMATQPNHFVLKGQGVEVDYTIGGNPSFTALTFKRGAFVKSFKPSEILTESTGLGKLISVSLITSIDTGGERFGFYLPFLEVQPNQKAHFHSVGVFEVFTGPDSIPHRPSTWSCIELSGVADSVIVPL